MIGLINKVPERSATYLRRDTETLEVSMLRDPITGRIISSAGVNATGEERFWAKVNKDGPVPQHAPHLGNCWIWTARVDRHGYGRFIAARPGPTLAHFFLVGKAPQGHEWDHLCRVTNCVRPSHLEAVVHQENVARGLRGRLVTHCPQGHEYNDANTYIWHGRRRCRICNRAAVERQRMKRNLR